jgi:hypothetical protein
MKTINQPPPLPEVTCWELSATCPLQRDSLLVPLLPLQETSRNRRLELQGASSAVTVAKSSFHW